ERSLGWGSGFRRENFTRPGKVGWSIDTERYGVNECDVDAHPRFERAELLELLADLERRRVQGHEVGECRAPEGVDADMVVERAIAMGRRSPGEVKSPQAAGTDGRAYHLHNIGVGALLVPHNLRSNGANLGSGIERAEARADEPRIERRQVTLKVDH